MTNVGLSHARAETFIPDPIHDKFSLTIFERDFIDSIYFQRLHFILQTSTNYVSFPSNKSTRFPHSIGVSHVAGRFFASAVSNAKTDDLRAFLRAAGAFVARVIDRFEDSFSMSEGFVDELIEAHFETISGQSGFIHNPIEPSDTGERLDTEDDDDGKSPFSASFLIDTLWQSVRLYALMHDLGHLPMSHAFERGLETTEDVLKANDAQPDVVSNYEKALSRLKRTFTGFDVGKGEKRFFDLFKDVLSIEKWSVSPEKIVREIAQEDIHEVRGLHLFNRYIRTARDIAPSSPDSPHSQRVIRGIDNYAKLVHIVTVFIIFSKSIKTKESTQSQGINDIHPYSFLYSLKRLVDGEIDADRLDYTLRDCHEAGAQFGSFDLESIIRYGLLFRDGGRPVFVFGFSHHAVAAIEQFYEARYQSYKYIINHRVAARANRCMEAAIAHMYAVSCMNPTGDVARLLCDRGYLRFGEGANAPVLFPDQLAVDDGGNGSDNRKKAGIPASTPNFDREFLKYIGHQIDDFSFRSLCMAVLSNIRGRLGTKLDKRREHVDFDAMELHLATLLEVVLFRTNENIITLFKNETMRDFVQSVSGSDNIEQLLTVISKRIEAFSETIGADDPIQGKLNSISKYMSNKYSVDFGIYIHYIKSKVYVNDFDRQFAEDRTLVKGSKPKPESIVNHSSSLRSMAQRRNRDLQMRIYAVSKDLKQEHNACKELDSLIREALGSALRD